MSCEDDLAYFERRRLESIERAEAALDPDMIRIYRAFAIHYTRALDQLCRARPGS